MAQRKQNGKKVKRKSDLKLRMGVFKFFKISNDCKRFRLKDEAKNYCGDPKKV